MVLKLKILNNFLKKFFSADRSLLIFFIVGFFSMFFVGNNKLFVLMFSFLTLVLFFVFKKNVWDSVFLIFLLSIPFENTIREWCYQITTPLFDNVLTSGYSLYFGISIKIILATFLFLLAIFRHKDKNIRNDLSIFSLLTFLSIASINTFLMMSTTLPILGLIRIWLGIWIFILSRIYFSKTKSVFFIFVIALYIFTIFFGGLQLIKQKPLGLYIELTPSFSKDDGYLTTDGEQQFRVSGFISHPVYFASFLSILFPIFLGYFLKKIDKKTPILNINIFTLLSVIGCGVIVGTLSRSALFTLVLTLVLFRKEIFEKIFVRYYLYNNFKIKILFKIFWLFFITGLIYFLIPRIKSFGLLFQQNGNASIRMELIKESFEMVYKNPFGVGLNNFTKELITYNLPESLNGFIVPVHNTFLIFFTELGILGGLSFAVFIFYIFFKKFNEKKKDLADFGVWVGILTFLINCQIHPLFNLDPTFDLIMLVLGYYSICLYQKK